MAVVNLMKANEGYEAFILAEEARPLEDLGVTLRPVCAGLYTAFIPRGALAAAAALPSVARIESATSCRPMLDVSMREIGVDRVWNGEAGTPYRGEGVLVGFVDYGIDWRHEDFIDGEGRSRILYLWDMTDTAGPPPAGFSRGTEYTRDQIDLELSVSPPGIVGEEDAWGHGTHVAGIAAGSGRAAANGCAAFTYVGAAPEAGMIVVKGASGGAIPDTYVIDGVRYIFEKAELLGRPAVVNLSLGHHHGPHVLPGETGGL